MRSYWSECPFCNDELILHRNGRFLMHPINGCIIQHTCFDYQNEEQRKKWNKRTGLANALREMQFEIDDSTNEEYNKGVKTAMEVIKIECGIVVSEVE